MRTHAGSLAMLVLAACSPEAAPPSLTIAEETSGIPAPEPAWHLDADLAGEARSFFFAQGDLYRAGVQPSANPSIADVLRALGRDDLAGPSFETGAENACPQQWVEPIEMIARATSGERFVIIETERSAPAQIAFAEDIVTRLSNEGFSSYADDGLTLGPGGAAHPDVPLITEGMVTRDTVYGRLLRAAKTGGLELIDAGVWWSSANELAALSPAEHMHRRREALAIQVSRRAFARNPEARVILHTQRSAEDFTEGSLKETATRLAGHEPLVIALTSCSETDEPPAFLPDHGSGVSSAASADLVFAIPRAFEIEGRLTSGAREDERAVDIPPSLLAASETVLIEARREGEPDLAVPEDRLMLFPGETLPLILPPGAYRIEAWTKQGPVAAPVSVIVQEAPPV